MSKDFTNAKAFLSVQHAPKKSAITKFNKLLERRKRSSTEPFTVEGIKQSALKVLDLMSQGYWNPTEPICVHFRSLLVELLRKMSDLSNLPPATVPAVVSQLVKKIKKVVPNYGEVYRFTHLPAMASLSVYVNWAFYLDKEEKTVGQVTQKELIKSLRKMTLEDLKPGISELIRATAAKNFEDRKQRRARKEMFKAIMKERYGEKEKKQKPVDMTAIYGYTEQGFVNRWGQIVETKGVVKEEYPEGVVKEEFPEVVVKEEYPEVVVKEEYPEVVVKEEEWTQ